MQIVPVRVEPRAPVAIEKMDRRSFFGLLFLTYSGSLITGCSSTSTSTTNYSFVQNPFIDNPLQFIKSCRDRGIKEIGITYHAMNLACKTIQNHGICRGTSGSIYFFDDLGNYSMLDTAIPAHSFNQHPSSKNLVWIIPNFESKSVLFDLNTCQVVDEFEFHNLYFYGHGLIFENNIAIATMASPQNLDRGIIIKFDMKTKKILQTLDIEDTSYHEIIYSKERKTLIASGRKSKRAQIFEISLPELKVVNDYSFHERYEFRHITFLNDGRLFLAGHGAKSLPYPYNVAPIGALDLNTSKFQVVAVDPKDTLKFSGEMLNFIFDDNQKYAYAINPYQETIFKVNLRSMKIEKTFALPIKAVAKISKTYVSSSTSFNRSYFSISNSIENFMEKISVVHNSPSGFGSHLYKITI